MSSAPLCLRHSFTQQDQFPIKQGELRFPFAPDCGSNTALFGVHSSRTNPFLFRQWYDLLSIQSIRHMLLLFLAFVMPKTCPPKNFFFSCLYLPKNNFDFFLAFLSTFAMIVYMQLTRLECRLWCRLKTHRLKAWRLESSKLWIRLGARGFEASAPNCRLEACGLDASKQGCRLVAGRLDWMLGNQVCKYQGYLSSVLEYTKGNYIWKTNIVLQHSFEVSRWIVFAKMLWWPYLKSMFEFLNEVRFIEF